MKCYPLATPNHDTVMPQAPDELQNRWDIDDAPVIAYLRAKGFVLLKNWCWQKPDPAHELTEAERSAIDFLILEWDFGGIEP